MCADIKPTQRLYDQWYSSPVCVVACTHQVTKLLPEPPCRSSGPPALEGDFGRSFEAMDRHPYACVFVCHGHVCACAYVRGRRMYMQMYGCMYVFCLSNACIGKKRTNYLYTHNKHKCENKQTQLPTIFT